MVILKFEIYKLLWEYIGLLVSLSKEIKDQNNPDVVYKVLKGSDVIAVLED